MAKQHTLYSYEQTIATYYITEDSQSYFNANGGNVTRRMEPKLFDMLVFKHGLARATELSPYMLSAESCVVYP